MFLKVPGPRDGLPRRGHGNRQDRHHERYAEGHCGQPVERIRRKHNIQRKRLQRKRTRGAKKKLVRVSGKEARFRRHENHCISKTIVESARLNGRGIAIENLEGIRGRVTARGGDARNKLSGWSFQQLAAFLSYKATLAGIPIVQVDPRIPARRVPSAGIVNGATARARLNSRASTAGSPRRRLERCPKPPGTGSPL